MNDDSSAGWIKWGGGECPVEASTLVDVKWNNGAVTRCCQAGLYSSGDEDLWLSRSHRGHIVSYQILPNPPDPISLPTVAGDATLADRLESWSESAWTADLSIGERTLAEDCRDAARLLRDNGSDRNGGDALAAPGEASQSGG